MKCEIYLLRYIVKIFHLIVALYLLWVTSFLLSFGTYISLLTEIPLDFRTDEHLWDCSTLHVFFHSWSEYHASWKFSYSHILQFLCFQTMSVQFLWLYSNRLSSFHFVLIWPIYVSSFNLHTSQIFLNILVALINSSLDYNSSWYFLQLFRAVKKII